MFTQKDDSEKARSVAFLVCVYKNDCFESFEEMLISLKGLVLPDGIGINVYLHIDGVLPDKFHTLINSFSPFKIIWSEKPVGLAKGLNKLIGILADELYYFRMDSDDVCSSDRVIKQVKFMNDNPELDFSGSSISEFVETKDNQVNVREYPSDMIGIKESIVKGSPFAHVTICFRGGFFNKFGSYPTSYPLNEDIALWYTVLKKGALASNLPDILVFVRMDSAYSRRTFRKAIYEFKVYKEIAQWLEKSMSYAYLRFIFRLLPVALVRLIYNSKFRNKFLNR